MLVCLWFFQNFLPISYEYQYMLIVSSAWICMRVLSYCLDKLSSADSGPSVSDFVMMLGYCFYFPLLFLGPLVLYQEFEAGVLKPYAPWTVQRVKTFILNILRYLWWMLFLELFLHFVYIGALQKEVQVGCNEQFLSVTNSGVANKPGSWYSRVLFCDGSFYDDSHLRPLSSRTEHSRLAVRHCHNSNISSVLSPLLALF